MNSWSGFQGTPHTWRFRNAAILSPGVPGTSLYRNGRYLLIWLCCFYSDTCMISLLILGYKHNGSCDPSHLKEVFTEFGENLGLHVCHVVLLRPKSWSCPYFVQFNTLHRRTHKITVASLFNTSLTGSLLRPRTTSTTLFEHSSVCPASLSCLSHLRVQSVPMSFKDLPKSSKDRKTTYFQTFGNSTDDGIRNRQITTWSTTFGTRRFSRCSQIKIDTYFFPYRTNVLVLRHFIMFNQSPGPSAKLIIVHTSTSESLSRSASPSYISSVMTVDSMIPSSFLSIHEM